MYEITSTALMYFELAQTVGVIASLSFLIQIMIECKSVDDAEDIE